MKIRILFMVGRELSYPRNDVVLRALNRIGEVDVCGVEKHPTSIGINSLVISIRALPRLLLRKYDLVFIGFYGHLLMLMLGAFIRCPILFDAFISTYDTLCFDRRTVKPSSILGRLAFYLDRWTCHRATHVLLDTHSHIEYFHKTFGIPISQFTPLPVGCNEDLFHSYPPLNSKHGTIVLYYSTFLPLHGVDVVIRAASLLKEESSIRFKVIGNGQEYSKIRKLAQDLNLGNVEFSLPVHLEHLPREIATADLCLGGHFGKTAKASRVVPGKIYQILAMGRPLIATSTMANIELLNHGETAYLCPPGDPEALASAIYYLVRNPLIRSEIGEKGRSLYLQRCSETVITEQLQFVINKISEG